MNIFFLSKLRFQLHLYKIYKSFLESKTNIGVINSSSSDDEEEDIEYKVKRIGNSEWCECSTEAVVGRCSSK